MFRICVFSFISHSSLPVFVLPLCAFSLLPLFYIFFYVSFFLKLYIIISQFFINFTFGFLPSFLSFCVSTLLAYFVSPVSFSFLNYSVLFFIFVLFPVFLPLFCYFFCFFYLLYLRFLVISYKRNKTITCNLLAVGLVIHYESSNKEFQE